jgi:hypothetical protein
VILVKTEVKTVEDGYGRRLDDVGWEFVVVDNIGVDVHALRRRLPTVETVDSGSRPITLI